ESDIARIDSGAFDSRAVRQQVIVTLGSLPTESALVLSTRNVSGSALNLGFQPTGALRVLEGFSTIPASTSPVFAAGDKILIDMVCALSMTPTTSNGRVFYRVRNLTNPTWNGSGEFFWDSLYTRDAGTTNF